MSALPVGTAVKMKLETPISTRTNKSGDRFAGRVTEGVTLQWPHHHPGGRVAGGPHRARPRSSRRIRGTPIIDLRPDTIIMPSGDRYSLNAVVVDTNARPDVDVNDEGKFKGRGHDGSDWKETGIVAAGGAIAGGVFKGVPARSSAPALAQPPRWCTGSSRRARPPCLPERKSSGN